MQDVDSTQPDCQQRYLLNTWHVGVAKVINQATCAQIHEASEPQTEFQQQ